jgi:NADPH-dependent 2,4-dienoyl-CoA reductase/sulfur reductase-like enzyme
MENDPQPRIAILGAGPIGLEAALYARYLGYPMVIPERADQPANIVDDTTLPFAQLASSLGVAALRAQNAEWQPPGGNEQLTTARWREIYLLPLAESDLIADVLLLGHEVVSIRRNEDDTEFEIVCRDSNGDETIFQADIVVDCTGVTGNREWFAEDEADPELGFLNPEADVYVLGSKSRANATMTFAEGLTQIRDLFAILGEREDLDLYATMPAIAPDPA